MSTYLISSDVSGITNYYTSDSSGLLTCIGITPDFTQGFDNNILGLIPNSTYTGLTNGKVWVDDTVSLNSVSVDTMNDGSVVSTDATSINTQGYSGVSSINPTVSGNVMFGLSFAGTSAFQTRAIQNSMATSPLIPTNSTAQAPVVTIGSAYAGLFNGSNTGFQSTLNTNTIPLTFATAQTLLGFFGMLNTGSVLPVTVSLQVYNAATSSYVTLATVNVNATNVQFNQTFTNLYSSTQYQFVLTFSGTGTMNIASLNVYNQVSTEIWSPLNIENIATQGISATALAALTSADYASIFNNTQLDYIVYTPNGGTFTSLIVAFPPDIPPSVTNFSAIPNSIHAQNVDIGFTVVDLENMQTTYSISLNGTTIVPATLTPSSNTINGIVILNDQLNVGSNPISITVTDELNKFNTYNFSVTKNDNLPTYVGTLVNHDYTFSVSDADMDQVQFSSTLNGTVIEPTSALQNTPFIHTTIMDSGNILVGKTNTLVITLTDSVGGVTTITETFIGTYDGLLFMDQSGNYLTTDMGELLENLNFGPILAGYDSIPQEVQVVNQTTSPMSSIIITGPEDINGQNVPVYDSQGIQIGTNHITGDTFVKLSVDSSFANSVNTLTLTNLNPGEKTLFYVRIESSNKQSLGNFSFIVLGSATSD